MKLAFFLTILLAVSAPAKDISFEYYYWDDAAQRFVRSADKRVSWGVYLCVAFDEKGDWRQFWTTRDDNHHIAPGSIVLGHRLNKPTKKGAAVYYRLDRNLDWHALNPDCKPVIWKYDPDSRKTYLAEEPLDNWASGHTLYEGEVATKVPMLMIYSDKESEPVPVKPRPKPEPPPAQPVAKPSPSKPPVEKPLPKPIEKPAPDEPTAPVLPRPRPPELGCEIEVAPARIAVGEMAILTMKTFGPVDSAMLDGAAVDFPVVLRSRVGEQPGEFTIKGEVTAKKETRTCEAKLTVEKK